MSGLSVQLSPEIQRALAAFAAAEPRVVHALHVSLARLVIEQAPPAALEQLELASRFIAGQASAEELRDAQQDCWTYVGSLACGCSVADSASAHAIMTCLETSAEAHEPGSLLEQAERVARCGASDARILQVLGEARLE